MIPWHQGTFARLAHRVERTEVATLAEKYSHFTNGVNIRYADGCGPNGDFRRHHKSAVPSRYRIGAQLTCERMQLYSAHSTYISLPGNGARRSAVLS